MLAYQPSPHPRITVPYSYFTQQVHARNVASVTAHGSTIQGTFRRAVTYPAQTGTTSSPQNGATSSQKPATATYFATTRPTFADDHLLSALLEEGAVVTAKPIQSGSNPLLTSSAASCQRFC